MRPERYTLNIGNPFKLESVFFFFNLKSQLVMMRNFSLELDFLFIIFWFLMIPNMPIRKKRKKKSGSGDLFFNKSCS
jgi:hypothetical protein